MTISLTRRQRLAAVAKAHDAWVDQNLAAVADEFDPAAHPKDDSDYNQHNLDVDATGEMEDELARMLEGVFDDPLTAAKDPDWDPDEHPRGPDGKFIESVGAADQAIKELKSAQAIASLAKSVAHLKGESYKALEIQAELLNIQKKIDTYEKGKKALLKKGKTSPSPQLPSAPVKPVSEGKPITAWTKKIYSEKYEDGQIVAVKDDGSARLVWDEESKKYQWQTKSAHEKSSGWITSGQLTKKDAYTKFKDEKKSWLAPAAGATVTNDAPPPPGFDASSEKGISSQFTILPKDKRGKSGDGYFAGNFWGRYGAAGLMMRHTDEKGEERFLLVQANMADNPATYGKWQLPGGALEEFETPEQGAAREAFEELGFDQDFLHKMKQLEPHKVSFDVPDYGTWSYSNITVDVPTRPEPKFDPYELGGAKWVTRDELDQMRKGGEIIKPLEANLDSILGKFTPEKPEPAPIKNQPGPVPPVRPSPVASVAPPKADAPAISTESTAATTKWTKAKFTQALAYKTSYDQREVVGMADIGDFDSVQILWESGKFRYYKYNYDKKAWLYAGTWNTKKDALASLKGKAFYQPPKGTMADFNQDYFNKGDLNAGFGTLTAQQQPDVLQELLDAIPLSAPASQRAGLKIEPWVPAFAHYKSSFILFNEDRLKVGAIHEGPDGEWIASAKDIFKPYMSAKAFFDTKEEAVEALANADVAYSAAQAKPAVSVPPTASSKKLSKLTAAQIEKQNGTVPKTLKHTQKATFLKNLKENSTAGFVHSGEPDPKKVFTALVEAVKRHNATQSPKLNYLQGINVLDQVYGSKQKDNVVAWLQTSEGKATAPLIVSAATGEKVVAIPNALSGVPSPYSIGTPKKVAPNAFRQMSLADMLEMHEKMYKKNPMTYKQRSTIAEYKGSSNKFNEPLRGNPLLPLDKYNLLEIQTLQGAMRPTTQSFVTYRGTDGLGAAINLDTIKSLSDLKKFEGSVVGDPAFLSTAFEQTAAFSDKHFKLFINVPEGTPGTFAYAASEEYRYEKEFTLAAGLHYRIDRAEEMVAGYNNGYYNIYMTVVPEVKKK